MRLLATIAVILTIYTSAFAQEKRVEMEWTAESGYSERETPSMSQALQSYISDQRRQEFLRAETGNCADPSACKELKVKVSQEQIGAPFEKRIFQIVFTLTGKPWPDEMPQPYWKSIVLETDPGMYRELLLLKNDGGFWNWPPSKSEIRNAGTSKLFVTSDQTTSRDMWCTGEFWVLGKSGSALADFSAVATAIDKVVPHGAQNITPMCAAVDLGKLEVRSDIQKVNPECNACGLEGHVVVKFKFEGQRAVPVSTLFEPESEK